jgi:hypothetical protein
VLEASQHYAGNRHEKPLFESRLADSVIIPPVNQQPEYQIPDEMFTVISKNPLQTTVFMQSLTEHCKWTV